MESPLSRLESVRQRVQSAARASGRDPSSVHLMAVSKGQPVEAIEILFHEGHRDFGENYVQELVAKATELKQRGCDGIRWHFIGHLQTNKVKRLTPWIQSIHSLDSERLARELDRRVRESGRAAPLPVFIEVNIDREPGKSGLSDLAELSDLVSALGTLPGLRLSGLMCVPSPEGGRSGRSFTALAQLAARLRESAGLPEPWELSMGMTQDFEQAITHGSSWIRVGTAIFGPRPARA